MADALPSWNDGEAKRAILAFVTASVTEGGPEFVPPSDRIATFDNDGTMWVEQPAPPQVDFIFRALATAAQADPALAATLPYKAILERDRGYFAKVSQQDPETILALEQAIARTWAGSTPAAFDAQVQEFFGSVTQERFGVSYADLVYVPMLELFDHLKANGYRVFVCSGGGRDFMRVIAEDSWGLFRENVIGTAAEYTYREGALTRGTTVLGGVALGPGKPEHIFARTGRLPLFAGGNADVDIEMLESARFGLLVRHDDAAREYAYTTAAEKAFAAAAQRGWTVASMKSDWNRIFRAGVEA